MYLVLLSTFSSALLCKLQHSHEEVFRGKQPWEEEQGQHLANSLRQ